MGVNISVTSTPDWLVAITELRGLKEKFASALYMEGERLMLQAKEQTPVLTGALRSSGMVEPPVWQQDVVQVSLGFGGPSIEYALIVHEDLSKVHPVGKAKFLEDPVRQNVESGASEARIKSDINRGSA